MRYLGALDNQGTTPHRQLGRDWISCVHLAPCLQQRRLAVSLESRLARLTMVWFGTVYHSSGFAPNEAGDKKLLRVSALYDSFCDIFERDNRSVNIQQNRSGLYCSVPNRFQYAQTSEPETFGIDSECFIYSTFVRQATLRWVRTELQGWV